MLIIKKVSQRKFFNQKKKKTLVCLNSKILQTPSSHVLTSSCCFRNRKKHSLLGTDGYIWTKCERQLVMLRPGLIAFSSLSS